MDFLVVIALIAVAALVVVVIALLVVLASRRTAERALRDDTQRVGQSEFADPGEAGQRATGGAAWMRPGGGGGL